jgi:hypothetical protein
MTISAARDITAAPYATPRHAPRGSILANAMLRNRLIDSQVASWPASPNVPGGRTTPHAAASMAAIEMPRRTTRARSGRPVDCQATSQANSMATHCIDAPKQRHVPP